MRKGVKGEETNRERERERERRHQRGKTARSPESERKRDSKVAAIKKLREWAGTEGEVAASFT